MHSLHSTAALSEVTIGLLATRVQSGTVAEVLPCQDGSVCLQQALPASLPRLTAADLFQPGINTL
jgi:hypothetical protein